MSDGSSHGGVERDGTPNAAVFLRNSEGTPVDAVPFLVTLTTAFLVVFSFGPVYGLALGWSVDGSLVASGLVFVGLGLAAYVQLVARARPEMRGEVPADQRLLRLVYAMVGMGVVVVALVLPLL